MGKDNYTFLAAWGEGGVEGIQEKCSLSIASKQITSEA